MIELNQKGLAELASRTDRMLRMIDKELPDEKKLLVKTESGKYDAGLFVQRWTAYQIEKATDGIDDLDAVKARHELVKTEKTTLEVARLRGELVSAQDVKRLWGDIAHTVMQNLLHIPGSVAPVVQGMTSTEAIQEILDAEVRRALNAISESPLPAYAAENGDEEEET